MASLTKLTLLPGRSFALPKAMSGITSAGFSVSSKVSPVIVTSEEDVDLTVLLSCCEGGDGSFGKIVQCVDAKHVKDSSFINKNDLVTKKGCLPYAYVMNINASKATIVSFQRGDYEQFQPGEPEIVHVSQLNFEGTLVTSDAVQIVQLRPNKALKIIIGSEFIQIVFFTSPFILPVVQDKIDSI